MMKSNALLDPKMNPLVNKIANLPWADPRFYQNWLAQSHYYTNYSTRMLAFAAGWSELSSQSFYRRSLNHIKEEQGHDVIATQDLTHLGGSLEKFPELGATRALWEPQFYKIQKDPTLLLGYILALEYFAVRTFSELFTKLSQAYPEKACQFVKVHAEDDPDHVEKAIQQIEMCSPAQIENIMKNYNQTCEVYGFMLDAIAATSAR